MNEGILKELHRRRDFFANNFPEIKGSGKQGTKLKNTCPSCGYLTLDSRASWEICGFCFWEDDGQDDADADKCTGGPNGDQTLTQHRIETLQWFKKLKSKAASSVIELELGQSLEQLDELIANYSPGMKNVLIGQLMHTGRLFAQLRGYRV